MLYVMFCYVTLLYVTLHYVLYPNSVITFNELKINYNTKRLRCMYNHISLPTRQSLGDECPLHKTVPLPLHAET